MISLLLHGHSPVANAAPPVTAALWQKKVSVGGTVVGCITMGAIMFDWHPLRRSTAGSLNCMQGQAGGRRGKRGLSSHQARHSYVVVIIHHMFVQARGIQHRCQGKKRGHYEKEIVKSVVAGVP